MEDFLEQVMFKLSLNGWVGLPGWFGGKESTCNAGDSDLIHESGRSPGKEMATHSSILAWEIPRTEEPGGLQSMGSQRVRHNWTPNTFKLAVKCEAIPDQAEGRRPPSPLTPHTHTHPSPLWLTVSPEHSFLKSYEWKGVTSTSVGCPSSSVLWWFEIYIPDVAQNYV